MDFSRGGKCAPFRFPQFLFIPKGRVASTWRAAGSLKAALAHRSDVLLRRRLAQSYMRECREELRRHSPQSRRGETRAGRSTRALPQCWSHGSVRLGFLLGGSSPQSFWLSLSKQPVLPLHSFRLLNELGFWMFLVNKYGCLESERMLVLITK